MNTIIGVYYYVGITIFTTTHKSKISEGWCANRCMACSTICGISSQASIDFQNPYSTTRPLSSMFKMCTQKYSP